MKRVFIVDDNADKMDCLVASVEKLYPEAEVSMFECMLDFERSICHTFAAEITHEPDEYLMVLDMQMPFKRDGRINADAGFELLSGLFRYDLQCPAIIVSSEAVDEKMAESIYEHFRGSVRYSPFLDVSSAIAEVLGINSY